MKSKGRKQWGKEDGSPAMRLPVAKTLSENIKERGREQRVGAVEHVMFTYLMPQKSHFIAFTYMGGISVQAGKVTFAVHLHLITRDLLGNLYQSKHPMCALVISNHSFLPWSYLESTLHMIPGFIIVMLHICQGCLMMIKTESSGRKPLWRLTDIKLWCPLIFYPKSEQLQDMKSIK